MPKIEIKNVKYAAFASEETHCFSAVVYIDGKRAFGVKNDGHGGCDDYYPIDARTLGDIWEQVRAINEELGKETIQFEDACLTNNLELVVGDLMNQWLRQEEARKLLRRIAYVKDDGDVYTLPAKHKPTAENLAAVQKASWWKKEYVLLNSLSIEEVIQHMCGEKGKGQAEEERPAERSGAAPAPGM